MPIVIAADTPVFDMHGVRFTGLAAPSRGSSETAVWHIRMAPDTAPTIHHVTREEIFVITSGKGRLTIDGKDFDLSAGDTAIVPPETAFAVSNPNDAPFEALVVLPVGGMAVLPGMAPFAPPWAL